MNGKVKILVIDDEADLRENLKYVFQMKGYEVELAEDGVQGLKKLETYTPDLIVLDLNMPNMGGIEFYQKICEGEVSKYPVFVLTARANMESFFRDFNVDGFMAKPFDIAELTNEVGAVLARRMKKVSHVPKAGGYKKIFIVESDQVFSGKVGAAFLMQGCTVNLARTGAEGLERMSKDVPDVALIQLRLSDIGGDVVAGKLKRMAKTSDVKIVLYAYGVAERQIVTDLIQQKAGVDKFVTANKEKDLVDAVAAL